MLFFTQKDKSAVHGELETYVNTYYTEILKYCRYHLRSDQYIAEDCTQEVFVTFYAKFDSLNTHDHIRAYLYRVADNTLHEYRRRLARENAAISFSLDDAGHLEDDPLSYEENGYHFEDNISIEATMKVVLGQLTPIELSVYNAAFVHKVPLRQIAEREGITESAVKMRLHRIKAKIRLLAREAVEDNDLCRLR